MRRGTGRFSPHSVPGSNLAYSGVRVLAKSARAAESGTPTNLCNRIPFPGRPRFHDATTTMKATKILNLSGNLLLLALSQASAQTSIGVQFLGRDASGDVPGLPGVPALMPSEVAGVVPQPNWNPVDDQNAFSPPNSGTTAPLWDQDMNPTTVTLTFDANDSWYNDVTPATITTPNARLMNG